jgi:hypothetical protein
MVINYVALRYIILSVLLLLMFCYRVLSDQKSANVVSLCVITAHWDVMEKLYRVNNVVLI